LAYLALTLSHPCGGLLSHPLPTLASWYRRYVVMSSNDPRKQEHKREMCNRVANCEPDDARAMHSPQLAAPDLPATQT
jgi:hypothetical protein